MKILITFIFLAFQYQALAEEIVYPGKFSVLLTKQYFTYKDSFLTENIPVQKCNEDIFKSAMDLFRVKEKKGLIPRLPSSHKITFLRDNKPIEIPAGSKVHLNLDSFNKTVQGHISRARSECSK